MVWVEVVEADHQDMSRKEVRLAESVMLLNDLVNNRLMTMEALVKLSSLSFQSLLSFCLLKKLGRMMLKFDSWDMGWEEEPAWVVVEEEVVVEQLKRRLLSRFEGQSRPNCHSSLPWLVGTNKLTCAARRKEGIGW